MKIEINIIVFFLTLILFVNLCSAMSATINIPEKYSEVRAGEKVYLETEIKWPENDARKDLRIEYSIKDQNDQEIAYLKVLKAIETQASFMDSISIPESTKGGTYKIFLHIKDYKEFSEEVAASFKVRGKTSDSFYLLLILGFVAFIAVAILVELFILIRKKNV
jgi:hypothetical protein